MPEEAGLHGGPLASSAGRATSSQPDLSGSTAHGGPANSNSIVRGQEESNQQYEEGSEYYDEEEEREIEAQV